MNRSLVALSLGLTLAGGVAATVWAAGTSPFGQLAGYDKVALVVERTPVQEKGLMIDGQLYVPAEALRLQNKMAYYYDPQAYQAYLFFGGARNGSPVPTDRGPADPVVADVMNGIPYDANNYHSGMMRQDIVNIATLAKALLETSRDLDSVVYAKLTFNRDPDFNQLRQRLTYRSLPFELMRARMEALADELGRQVGSSKKRKMEDVMDALDEAVRQKQKALDALEDWVRTSNENDLDDFRDYERDAKNNIADAIKWLTGENPVKPADRYDNNLKAAVEKWADKIRK